MPFPPITKPGIRMLPPVPTWARTEILISRAEDATGVGVGVGVGEGVGVGVGVGVGGSEGVSSEVVPVGWTGGPSKLIKTFAGRASGLVAVEDRSD